MNEPISHFYARAASLSAIGLCFLQGCGALQKAELSLSAVSNVQAQEFAYVVRGYRSPNDQCRIAGESDFTSDFLDDAAILVACPTGSTDASSLVAESDGIVAVDRKAGYTFYSVPQR